MIKQLGLFAAIVTTAGATTAVLAPQVFQPAQAQYAAWVAEAEAHETHMDNLNDRLNQVPTAARGRFIKACDQINADMTADRPYNEYAVEEIRDYTGETNPTIGCVADGYNFQF